MPAMRTKLHLIADSIGTFKGVSSNISGTGFAGMTFVVNATTEADFAKWVGGSQSSSKHMNMDEYNELVKPSEYNPVATYQLSDSDLFDQILMKYMAPPK